MKMLPSPMSMIIAGTLFAALIFLFDGYIIFSELSGGLQAIETTVLLMCLLCMTTLTVGEILDILALVARKISLALALIGSGVEEQEDMSFLVNEYDTTLRFSYILLALVVLHILENSRIFTYSIPVVYKIVAVVTASTGFTTLLMSEYPTTYPRLNNIISKVSRLKRTADEEFSKAIRQVLSIKRILLPRASATLLYTLMVAILFQKLLNEEAYLLLGITVLSSITVVSITAVIFVRSWSQLPLSWREAVSDEPSSIQETEKDDEGLSQKEAVQAVGETLSVEPTEIEKKESAETEKTPTESQSEKRSGKEENERGEFEDSEKVESQGMEKAELPEREGTAEENVEKTAEESGKQEKLDKSLVLPSVRPIVVNPPMMEEPSMKNDSESELLVILKDLEKSIKELRSKVKKAKT